ncbi:uncharacterized protein [Palaemon carinicauda]|uniref:uncharacterized protein n=1 Tax=Palaemon carinicauda TaxID=392227 RepID=UPI0035B58D42
MSNPPNLNRLTKSTMSCLDSDDFMQIINKMMIEKEDLQSKISQKIMELNTWSQVLQTSSVEEANELVSMLPETHTLSEEETEILLEYKDLSEMVTAYSHVDFCRACTTDEGDTLLEFSSPFPGETRSKFSVWLTTTENNEYEIKHHNFPDTIPVSEILQEQIASGRDDGIKRFSTVVKQYLWPLFHREYQAFKFHKSDCLSQSNHVYRFKDCTLMSFTVPLEKNGVSGTYEFLLKYEIMDILPYEVKISHFSKDEPSVENQNYVKELAKEMKEKQFWEVITSELSTEKTTTEGFGVSGHPSRSQLFGTGTF